MLKQTTEKIHHHDVTIINVETPDMKFKCMSLGATILDIQTKDHSGKFESVVMQFDSLSQYDHNKLFLNQIIGPTAGRLPEGPYTFGGEEITLNLNNGNAHLHGGRYGIMNINFDVEVTEENSETRITFKTSSDQESFYPGVQTFKITYTIKGSSFTIDFEADTTAETLINLTSHLYFNLRGNMKESVLHQVLHMTADRYLALDDDFIPVTIKPVTGTHLDFNHPSLIGNHMTKEILAKPEKGIDNPLLFGDKKEINLYDPTSKRSLMITTDYPSVVVYTDNHNQGYTFKHMTDRVLHMGICFETQLPPNGIHIPGCEDGILSGGEHYHYTTHYRFDVTQSYD
ncbi:MAG: hypothetical protein UMR38_07120 [Candidatus Izemoplasma sp.]|nr:hypothetical protein [Candidatus Izemoplasma sp.]